MVPPRETVERGLDALVEPLKAFITSHVAANSEAANWVRMVEERDSVRFGKAMHYSDDDPGFLLRFITENRAFFQDSLGAPAFAHASELRTVGNAWAHNEQFAEEDAARAIDTMARLVRAVGDPSAADSLLVMCGASDASSGAKPTRPTTAVATPKGEAARPDLDSDGEPEARATPAPTHTTTIDDADESHDGSAVHVIRLESDETRVELTFSWALNYALAYNQVSPLHTLVIKNLVKTELEVTGIHISLHDPEGRPISDDVLLSAATISAKQQLNVSSAALRTRLLSAPFAAATESVPGAQLRMAIYTDRGALSGSAPLRILARQEWLFGAPRESLAAFIRPRDPVLVAVLSEASSLLQSQTNNGSFLGYQAGSDRAVVEARAIYDALRDRGIRYVAAPASYTDNAQVIRTHAEVLETRFGTCLDLATIYAAALEAIGLNPVVIVCEGHALAGFLAEGTTLDEAVLDSEEHGRTISTLVDSGALVPIETTAITIGDTEQSFDVARQRALAECFRSAKGAIKYIIDVRAAHRRLHPLPALGDVQTHAEPRWADGLVESPVTPAGFRGPDITVSRPAAGQRRKEEYPARVDKWRNGLLDLTFRNPLLNLRTKTSGLDLHVPHGSLARLEDMLSQGDSFTLIPHDKLAEIHREQGARSAQDVDPHEIARILTEERGLFCTVTSESYGTRLTGIQRRARTIEQETGANNLYIVLGTLEWTDGNREAVRAPLFLMPVRLRGSRTRGFSLQMEEGGYAVPNQCLLEKLRITYNLKIPAYEEPQADDAGIDIPDSLQQVRLALLDAKLDFRVDETAHLSTIQFSTLQMWQDLSDNWPSFLNNPVVRHMVETPTDSFEGVELLPTFDPSAETEAFLPIAADGSQIEAIQWAAAGQSFVLEGPPGTGKSQTITNMIAHLLALGKRVLFVAEKQAALSVVQRRLDAVGLGVFALDVHGRNQTPMAVRAQLRAALNARADENTQTWESARQQYRALAASLAQYPKALHAVGPAGFSAWTARQAILSLAPLGGIPDAPPLDEHLATDPSAVAAIRATRVDIEEALRSLGTSPSTNAWRFADVGVDDTVNYELLSESIGNLVSALSAIDAGGIREIVDAIDDQGHFAGVATWLDSVSAGVPINPTEASKVVDDRWVTNSVERFSKLNAAIASAGAAGPYYLPTFFEAPLDAVLAEARLADKKLFKKRARRRALSAMKAFLSPGSESRDVSRITYEIESLSAARDAARFALAEIEDLPLVQIPAGVNPFMPDVHEEIYAAILAVHGAAIAARLPEAALRAVQGFANSDESRSRGAVRMPSSAPEVVAPAFALRTSSSGPGLGDLVRQAVDAANTFVKTAHATPESLTSWRGEATRFVAIRSSLREWQVDARGLNFIGFSRWRRFIDACRRLAALGASDFAEALLAGDVESWDVERKIELAISTAALSERLTAAGLGSFDDIQRDYLTSRFIKSGDDVRRRMLSELPARILRARSFSGDRLIGRVGELDRETSRKRGGRTIRNMFADLGSVIGEVTPCLLMSPHSIARFMPPAGIDFDVVIFDEASQIRVAEAVGAMGRAKSVIVVGDSRQMPPTSFATISRDDLDDDPSAQEILAPADQESILSEAVESRLPRRWLSWHYRSRDEALIAFSNERYYEGRLSTFPGPPEAKHGGGLSVRNVHGHFDRGTKRINTIEADAIIDDIRRRCHEAAGVSLGVITFNQQQAELILDKLEVLDDPAVKAALERDDDAEPIFVKNLENVQGDERDVILFSLAFSVDPKTGKLPLNFGPLNREGGERRLNVAITRARNEVLLFSSFAAKDIDLARTSSQGLADLRDYLLLAEGAARPGGMRRRTKTDDLHRDEIEAALVAAGLEVQADVGLSDFSVDLAIRASAKSPWIAVLLDGPGWSGRRVVSDRDALPQKVLVENLGWTCVERVYLPSWLTNPDAIVERLVQSASRRPEDAKPVAEGDENTPLESLNDRKVAQTSESAADHRPNVVKAPPSFVPASGAVDWTLDGNVLDLLPSSWAQKAVWGVAEQVIGEEGPVEVERLAKTVAGRFGLSRVRAERVAAILRCLPGSQVDSTPFGKFAWPKDVDPAAYTDFRPTSPGVDRPIAVIAPQEIANAMVDIARASHGIDVDGLVKETGAAFAYSRLTVETRKRLEEVLAWAVSRGLLTNAGGVIEVR